MAFSDSLGMRLRRAYMTMHRYAQNQFAQFGVTADQYVVLCLLAEKGGVRQQTLAEHSCSDPNTIAAMLNLLEQKRLVRRRPDPSDGRARLVWLTAHGTRLQKRLVESVEPIHAAMLEGVGDDWNPLIRSLQALESKAELFRKNNTDREAG